LDLTDQQKTELKAIAAAADDDIAPYVEELKSLKADMEEIVLSNETIDTAEGSDACLLVDEMIRVRTQIMEIAAKARLESANVLTIEQREIVIERRKARQERREERREEWKERLEHLIEDID
jgi:Spy/CpxP family protein refolding chaperone